MIPVVITNYNSNITSSYVNLFGGMVGDELNTTQSRMAMHIKNVKAGIWICRLQCVQATNTIMTSKTRNQCETHQSKISLVTIKYSAITENSNIHSDINNKPCAGTGIALLAHSLSSDRMRKSEREFSCGCSRQVVSSNSTIVDTDIHPYESLTKDQTTNNCSPMNFKTETYFPSINTINCYR
ncbi:hypothetical protein GJ496_000808 [Pomphorhynchus laevis]|nr:hypothetical protein GJ496_000808 [Pomphorhynchus laevis]